MWKSSVQDTCKALCIHHGVGNSSLCAVGIITFLTLNELWSLVSSLIAGLLVLRIF